MLVDTINHRTKVNSGSTFLVNKSLVILVAFIIINILLVIDTSIVRISTFTGGIYPFESYMTLFTLIYVAYATGNVIIIRVIKNQFHTPSSNKSVWFQSFFTGITATQYAILFVILILLVQILSDKTYPIWMLKSISYNQLSYGWDYALYIILQTSILV